MRVYEKKRFVKLKNKAEHIRRQFLEMICLGSMILCLGLSTQIKSEGLLGWWGFLYPKFCMMEAVENTESMTEGANENTQSVVEGANENTQSVIEEVNENQAGKDSGFYTKNGIKISFWLAKVFDW